MTETLADAARAVLATADPGDKAARARAAAAAWRSGAIAGIGAAGAPDRPTRPAQPELRPARDMPRRRMGRSPRERVALVHALAHIELNAVDLAWDLVARFADQGCPRAFYDDWVRVGDEEARHFLLLAERLAAFGAAYGDLPAHDGLWEAAEATAGDLLARLAVVPLVLEARGLDVTPPMIERLRGAGDATTVAVLETIYRDEIGHVAIGRRWFAWTCARRGVPARETWQCLVRAHFRGDLKPPFNVEGRERAGLTEDFYAPLAAASS